MDLTSFPKPAGECDSQFTTPNPQRSPLWLGIAGGIGIGSGLLGLVLAQAVTGTGYSFDFFMPLLFCVTIAILGRDKIGIGGRLFWWQLVGFPLMIAVTIGTATLVRSFSPSISGNSSIFLVFACIAPYWIAKSLQGEKKRQVEAIGIWVSTVVILVFAGVALNVIWIHWPLPATAVQPAIGAAISWGAGLFLMALGFWLARLLTGRSEHSGPAAWGEGRA